MDCIGMVVNMNADELGNATHSSESPKSLQKCFWQPCKCYRSAIDENHIRSFFVNLLSTHRDYIFSAKNKNYIPNRILCIISGDMRHQCEVLNKTAGFTFWSV